MFSLFDESADAHTPSTARAIPWPRDANSRAVFMPIGAIFLLFRKFLIYIDKFMSVKIVIWCCKTIYRTNKVFVFGDSSARRFYGAIFHGGSVCDR